MADEEKGDSLLMVSNPLLQLPIDNSSMKRKIPKIPKEVEAWAGFGGQTVLKRSETYYRRPQSSVDYESASFFQVLGSIWKLMIGSMPVIQLRIRNKVGAWGSLGFLGIFIDSCLRGVGQVMFMNNPITGILFLIGILLSSTHTAVYCMVGVICSTATAYILGLDRNSISNGLFGFNGALVGAGIAVFERGSSDHWSVTPQEAFPIIIMSCLSSVVTAAIGGFLVGRFGLSPFTFPFQVCVWSWMLGCSTVFSAYFPPDGNLISPSVTAVPVNSNIPNSPIDYDEASVIDGIFRGICQVFFEPHTVGGVVMLIGIAICSPIASVSALFGSALGTLFAMMLGASPHAIGQGLWGFNPTLTSIAIGGMFFVAQGYGWIFYNILAILLTTILTGGTIGFLEPVGMPTLTFPFVATCWMLCIAGSAVSSIVPVPLVHLSIPEDHRNRLLLMKAVQSKFSEINVLNTFISWTSGSSNDIEKEYLPILICTQIGRGNLLEIQNLIDLGANFDCQDYDGRSPLHIAASDDRVEILRMLLREGRCKNINPEDVNGNTPLNDAVRAGNSECVKLLISNSATLTLRITDIHSFKADAYLDASEVGSELCILIFLGKRYSVMRFIECGVDVNCSDYDKRSPLHLAVCCNDPLLCSFLVSRGANVQAKDRFGNSPLDDANRCGFSNIAELLNTPREELAANIMNSHVFEDSEDDSWRSNDTESLLLVPSAVCIAAGNGNIEQLKLLLRETNVDPSAGDYDGRTALHVAAVQGRNEIVELLLSRGANANAIDRWGRNPLWEAIRNENDHIATLLRSHGAVVSISECRIAIILCTLALEGNIHRLTFMVRNGCSVDSADYDKRTALHVAKSEGRTAVYDALISLGANPALRDRWGNDGSVARNVTS